MTQLLVSVRNRAEALAALAGGADLIDVKEPWRGSLGAAPAHVMEDVSRTIAGRAPLSVALGELLEQGSPADRLRNTRIEYAKVGLAGCARATDWRERLAQFWSELPAGAQPVAVVYADDAAQSPSPEEVLELAAREGARYVLVDTFNKRSGGLLAHWSVARVAEWIEAVHARQLGAALAGSLDRSAAQLLLPLAPDVIAVRGAVCRGARTSQIDEAFVRHFAAELRSPASP